VSHTPKVVASHVFALSRCIRFGVALIVVLNACSTANAAFTYTPFGANGEGGSINGQVLFFGSGGEVFELDAFVNIGGLDLNGPALGTSAQLSNNPLPVGLSFAFSSELSPDESDLTLTYTLSNTSGATIPAMWFSFFVDPEIDVAINDYFNEAGLPFGTLGPGGGGSADSWEIDEPGYVFGDVFSNLLNGDLDNTNAVPESAADDVSLALGFTLGEIVPGGFATISILLSDDGDRIGTFALQAFDTDPDSFDDLTVSGTATIAVPEPTSGVLTGLGLLCASLAAWCRRRQASPLPVCN